ncbi:MAG TPA: pyrimidine dimer DNA glycosylase/endonuclease V [Spirochaetota bacterium]|nr:pyrimidine dimer DNA glycosylase/endonuclease V [Spirochaetota bacterium]
MRLWSLHPEYLDPKGLVAVWREGLLAKKVLAGKTKGYTNHPQLLRFKNYNNPMKAIDSYLFWIYKEAQKRGYHFAAEKINEELLIAIIPVTTGQLEYEFDHLLKKVYSRNLNFYERLLDGKNKIICHPVFYCIEGDMEQWEIKR